MSAWALAAILGIHAIAFGLLALRKRLLSSRSRARNPGSAATAPQPGIERTVVYAVAFSLMTVAYAATALGAQGVWIATLQWVGRGLFAVGIAMLIFGRQQKRRGSMA